MTDDKKPDKNDDTSSSESEDSNTSQDDSKRKTLRNILMATGALAGTQVLPSKWSKPVLDTVVLPAHAGISGPTAD
jgi:hypothetical protein